MSTEDTWTHRFEGALESAGTWVERPATEAPRAPGPTGGWPDAQAGHLLGCELQPEAAVGDTVLAAVQAPQESPAFGPVIEALCPGDRISLKRLLDTLERLIIIRTLNRSRGNQRTAAARLGLKYTTLNEKVKRYGLRFSKNVQSAKTWTAR